MWSTISLTHVWECVACREGRGVNGTTPLCPGRSDRSVVFVYSVEWRFEANSSVLTCNDYPSLCLSLFLMV